MPLAKAALFLSGLPTETTDEEDVPLARCSPDQDAMLRRKCEIHLVGLQRRAAAGDRDAKADAVKIAYGLEINRSSTLQCVYALKAAGVDLDRLSAQLKSKGM